MLHEILGNAQIGECVCNHLAYKISLFLFLNFDLYHNSALDSLIVFWVVIDSFGDPWFNKNLVSAIYE